MVAPKVEFFKNDDSEVFEEMVFGIVEAGENSNRPSDTLLYPIHLWNDKGGVEGSSTMLNIKVAVIRKYIKLEPLGISDGTPDQTFYATILPILNDSQTVYVATVIWEKVDDLSLVGAGNYYECDDATGQIKFGDGVNGNIPANGAAIEIDYTPDKVAYGKEWAPDKWMKVKSFGVIGEGIDDDLDGAFYHIGDGEERAIGDIPSNCARKLFFELDAPREAEPAGGSLTVKIKVSYQYDG